VTRKKTARTSPAGPIELAAELTIAHAADLQRALRQRLSLGGALIIDGSAPRIAQDPRRASSWPKRTPLLKRAPALK